MKQVGYNFNNYQMNTRNVQKKEAEEKAKEAKGETKPESQAPVTVNPEPVTANALDVIARQNQGLQGLSKPKEVDKGGDKGNTAWYDQLVTNWNNEHENWSLQEQILAVSQIIDVAPPNKVSYWHCIRAELRGQLMEYYISQTNPNSLYPPNDMGEYNEIFGNFGEDYADLQQDVNFSSEILNNPDEHTNIEKRQAYKAKIALCEVLISVYSAQLNSPNFTTEDKIQLAQEIESLRAEIAEYQRKIGELESTIVKDDSVVAQTQVNTPSVD